MFKHQHALTVFEQEVLRLASGSYCPDAPELLRRFWLERGLYVEVLQTDVANVLLVGHVRCVEDVS